MAIGHIAVDDTGSVDKVNAAIDKANDVPNKAAAADVVMSMHRPGESGDFFTDSVNGAPSAKTPWASKSGSGTGNVAVVNAAGIVATRGALAIEDDRLYRIRFVVRRSTNVSDPSNDTVQLGLRWLDTAFAGLSTTVVENLLDLHVSDGRTERSVVMSSSGGTGVDIVRPGGAIYVRPFVQCFGSDGVTYVEIIEMVDETSMRTQVGVVADDIDAVDTKATQEIADRKTADANRPLATQVPGIPSLSPDVAFEVINSRTGQRVAAIMAWGEVVAPGKPVLDAVYGSMRTDPNGTILDGVRRDGSRDIGPFHVRQTMGETGFWGDGGGAIAIRNKFGVDIEADEYDAWISSGQVYAYVRGNVVQLTNDGSHSFLKADIRGGRIAMVRDDGTRFSTPLAGTYPTDVQGSVVEYSDLYGQSVAAGNAADLVTATAFNDRFWMFGAGQRAQGNIFGYSQNRDKPQQLAYDAIHDIVKGYESLVDNAGETANSGFGYNVLADSTFPAAWALMTTCSAVGSANKEMLLKNATEAPDTINSVGDPWNNLVSKFIRAALFLRLQGKRFLAGPLRYNQGEGNYNDPKATFLTALQSFRDDWQALAAVWNALRVSGDGGFTGKAPLITTQMCAGAHYTKPLSEVPWAQLQINVDDPTTALCIGPVYDQAYEPDGVHLNGLGQEMQGARQAIAYLEWLKGNSWHPLAVRKDGGNAPSRSGTTVTLKLYNHFDVPLIFDTTGITGLGADQGFVWRDNGDGNAVTVTNAVITDHTTLTLTLSAVPTGTGGGIDVAMNGASGANSGPSTGNRSTLRTNGVGKNTKSGRAIEFFVCIDRVAVS